MGSVIVELRGERARGVTGVRRTGEGRQGGRRLSRERQPLRCPWGRQRWGAVRRGDTCIAQGMEVGPYAVPEGVSLCPAELEGQNQAQLSTVVNNNGYDY